MMTELFTAALITDGRTGLPRSSCSLSSRPSPAPRGLPGRGSSGRPAGTLGWGGAGQGEVRRRSREEQEEVDEGGAMWWRGRFGGAKEVELFLCYDCVKNRGSGARGRNLRGRGDGWRGGGGGAG